MNSVVYCKTLFLPDDFVAFHSSSTSVAVHDALRPGMVRVTSSAVQKEFAQFVFSLLLEILDACLVSSVSAPTFVVELIALVPIRHQNNATAFFFYRMEESEKYTSYSSCLRIR